MNSQVSLNLSFNCQWRLFSHIFFLFSHMSKFAYKQWSGYVFFLISSRRLKKKLKKPSIIFLKFLRKR